MEPATRGGFGVLKQFPQMYFYLDHQTIKIHRRSISRPPDRLTSHFTGTKLNWINR